MPTKKADKFYLNAEGEKVRHAATGVVAVVFEFANGHTETIDPAKYPKDIRECFTLNGIAQKLGDSYSGSEDVDAAIERFLTVQENLMEGNWVSRAEGAAPRVTLIAEALLRTKPDKYPDIETASTEVKSWDTDKRKGVLDAKTGVKALIAHYEAIKAERAADRAKKALEAAGKDDAGVEAL